MSEAKTKPTEASVTEFLEKVEPQKKREEAKVILELFEKVTGEQAKLWGPSIIGFGEYHTTYESGRDVHWPCGFPGFHRRPG